MILCCRKGPEPDALASLEEAAAQVLGGFSAAAAGLDQRAESAAAGLLGLDQPRTRAPSGSGVPGPSRPGTPSAGSFSLDPLPNGVDDSDADLAVCTSDIAGFPVEGSMQP